MTAKNDRQMSEHQMQVALMEHLTMYGRRDLFWFAVPNAGMRSMRVGAMMKAEGLKPGVADLCFMLDRGRVAFLEMKTRTGKLSVYQEGFQHRCKMLGHVYEVAYSLDEAIAIVTKWGVMRSKVAA